MMRAKNRNRGRPALLLIGLMGAAGLAVAGFLGIRHIRQTGCAAAEMEVADHGERKHTNLLVHETSPYLLQHAHNPVNWHPWGDEAFQLAKKQNKPIFLSVGYSTCYWCHVMERESFENEEVAQVLNEHFIAIKVDREERPDIDEQYMLATQLTTGRGGWPNSVWLMPDGRPWMAGTYFPRDQFITLLKRLADFWKNQPNLVEQQADTLAGAIKQAAAGETRVMERELNRDLVAAAVRRFQSSFDPIHAGFGGAPKFPPHGTLRLLTDEVRRTSDPALQKMLTRTLDAMWHGGIHDHIGGGFHRYATDQRWFLPHFEKMLYDNAQLIRAYADAYALTGEERYRTAVADIFGWLRREMTHPDGAFYSALDSESEGEEGRFYVWSYDEVLNVLGKNDGRLFAEVYGFRTGGNFTEEATGHRPGTNIPYLPKPLDQVAREKGLAVGELRADLARMREKLLATRARRAYPHLDDKIIAGWNGLAIAALARAGEALDEPSYTAAAARAADFIFEKMLRDGTLMRTWRNGEARSPGYLDDYAFLADGLLELHTATGERRWLDRASQLAGVMLKNFQDERNGGFFFTSDEHPDLIVRSKNLLGGGNIPSGNGVAAQVLIRLGHVTGDARYAEAARRTLESLSGVMASSPSSSESLIVATAMLLDPSIPLRAGSPDAIGAGEGEDARPKADAVHVQRPVTARLYASRVTVRPGQSLQLAVSLDIDEGWHLYGPNPEVKILVPTTVSVQPNEAITAAETTVPKGMVKDDPVLKQAVETYQGRIWFRIPLTVADDAEPGETALKVQLRTQACDENRCLAPRTDVLELPITLRPDAPEHELRHPMIFDSKTEKG